MKGKQKGRKGGRKVGKKEGWNSYTEYNLDYLSPKPKNVNMCFELSTSCISKIH